MKGKTIIELVDEKTGEREVIAENNMIGPSVQELLKVYEKWPGNRLLFRYLSPLYQTLFGGILLFEDPVAETAVQVPGGNTIIGAGAYQFSDQLSNVNGDYNMAESEVTATYAKHVWDFKTNQANGRISSICLCDANYTKGYIYGCDYLTNAVNSSDGNAASIDLPLFGYSNATISSGSGGYVREFAPNESVFPRTDKPKIVYIANDFSEYVALKVLDEFTFEFTRYRIKKNDFNFLETANHAPNEGIAPAPVEVEKRTFTLGTTIKSKYPGFGYDPKKQKFYVLYSSSTSGISGNASMPLIEFDFSGTTLASVTKTEKTFTNKTTVTLSVAGTSSYNSFPVSSNTSHTNNFAVHNGFLYFVANGGVYKININDNSAVLHIKNPKFNLSGSYLSGSCFSDDEFVHFGYYYYYASGTYQGGGIIVNTVKNTVHYQKYNAFFRSNPTNETFIPTKTPSIFAGGSPSSAPVKLVATRNYLSTINNLAQPVVKTNDKTMKVTYILEQDTGGI